MLRIAQWCGLGVNPLFLLADIGGTQNAQPFGVSGHNSVLDSVMDHLHEMAGPVRTAVQVPVLGSPFSFIASWRAHDVACAWGQRLEDRIESFNHIRLRSEEHTSELQS